MLNVVVFAFRKGKRKCILAVRKVSVTSAFG